MAKRRSYHLGWQRDLDVTIHHVPFGRYPTATHKDGHPSYMTKGFAAYVCGAKPANYPVPSTEFDNALAAPAERLQFRIKAMLLRDKATLSLTGYGL